MLYLNAQSLTLKMRKKTCMQILTLKWMGQICEQKVFSKSQTSDILNKSVLTNKKTTFGGKHDNKTHALQQSWKY